MTEARFAAARLWAASRAPYLASALFACVPVPAPGTATIRIDRSWRVHADPDTVDGLEPADLGRLLIHLVGHVVRDHADRARALGVDDGSAPAWLRCADAEINDDLEAGGLLPPVANVRPADLGHPDGKLAEAYYGLGPSRRDGTPGWDCGSGADGQARPGDGEPGGLRPGEAERLRHSVAAEIQQAHTRNPGSVPGGWMRWAETVRPSRTDWRRVLGAEIRRAAAAVAGQVDYTYRRPARRSHSAPPSGPRVVLPTLYRPVPEVAIVCDTSGSMDEHLLAIVLAEVDAILARTGLRAVGAAVLAVDTAVHASRRARRGADVALAGGGGTDMGAGIAAAAARRPRPELIVVLTDGYTPWPERAPRGVRVVVAVLGDGPPRPEPPAWAKVVRIES